MDEEWAFRKSALPNGTASVHFPETPFSCP
jgi:hypothetical protein